MTTHEITIDMDKKCAECGKGGATQSGICFACVCKVMDGSPLKSMAARLARKRFEETVSYARRQVRP